MVIPDFGAYHDLQGRHLKRMEILSHAHWQIFGLRRDRYCLLKGRLSFAPPIAERVGFPGEVTRPFLDVVNCGPQCACGQRR